MSEAIKLEDDLFLSVIECYFRSAAVYHVSISDSQNTIRQASDHHMFIQQLDIKPESPIGNQMNMDYSSK